MTDSKNKKEEEKKGESLETPQNLEDDLFEEFAIEEDWAEDNDDTKQPLWQAGWGDEEDPSPDAPDFQTILREQMGKGTAAPMKE